MDNVLECGDGNSCNVETNDLGWDCCSNRGRNKCPANFPVMCQFNKCGKLRDQHCCAESVDKCRQLYDLGEARTCDASRKFL